MGRREPPGTGFAFRARVLGGNFGRSEYGSAGDFGAGITQPEPLNCGVEAFCYYHYWFGHGKRLLERPFEEVLSSGEPDYPFCLCWANQSWTGVWHGVPNRTLIEQTYPGDDDYRRHFDTLLPAFED